LQRYTAPLTLAWSLGRTRHAIHHASLPSSLTLPESLPSQLTCPRAEQTSSHHVKNQAVETVSTEICSTLTFRNQCCQKARPSPQPMLTKGKAVYSNAPQPLLPKRQGWLSPSPTSSAPTSPPLQQSSARSPVFPPRPEHPLSVQPRPAIPFPPAAAVGQVGSSHAPSCAGIKKHMLHKKMQVVVVVSIVQQCSPPPLIGL
jgi:hypothetical protein